MSISRWPASWLARAPRPVCPSCGAGDALPVVHGYPSPDVVDAIESGVIRVAFGGCEVGDVASTHRCVDCGHDFVRDAAVESWEVPETAPRTKRAISRTRPRQ